MKTNNNAMFILTVDKIEMAFLTYVNGLWKFQYAEDFKKLTNEYNLIIGFPDVDKEYFSDMLWPFFQIRIPGLKQPVVKEILEKENIEKEDEVALLKRFGQKCISNPYTLIFIKKPTKKVLS